ncbi:MAG: energy transducer TonB [Dokdonella sp.]
MLDNAAIAAVKNWVFNPGSKGGQPTRGYVLVPISWKLTE